MSLRIPRLLNQNTQLFPYHVVLARSNSAEAIFPSPLLLEITLEKPPLISWGWAMLRRPFTERIASLPEYVVTAARERGRQLDYWETAGRLLEELKEMGWEK